MAHESPHSNQKVSPSIQPSGKSEAAPHGNPAHSHEGTDVAIRPLIFSLVALILLAVFVLGLTYAIFQATEHVQMSAQDFQSGLTARKEGEPGATLRAELPQEPRIQGIPGFHNNNPAVDMKIFNTRNDFVLGTPHGDYVAAEEGRPARIPIARAMQLTLDRKVFKVAASQPAAEATPPKPETISSEPAVTPRQPAPTEGTAR